MTDNRDDVRPGPEPFAVFRCDDCGATFPAHGETQCPDCGGDRNRVAHEPLL